MAKMTLVIDCPGIFPRHAEINGNTYRVYSASTRDEFQAFDRMRYLIREMIYELNIDTKVLNQIGFSKQDAGELSMVIEDLEHDTPPPWEL